MPGAARERGEAVEGRAADPGREAVEGPAADQGRGAIEDRGAFGPSNGPIAAPRPVSEHRHAARCPRYSA